MKKVIIIIFVILSIPVLIYFLNPFNTISYDPRARITGIIPYKVPGSSMKPTLKKGDFLIVSVLAYIDEKPKVNDLISFRLRKGKNIDYLKRVIAFGGDEVSIIDGKVFVNNKEIHQPYVELQNNLKTNKRKPSKWNVPANTVFVLGDNRDNSYDSRYFGFIPVGDIIGKVVTIIE